MIETKNTRHKIPVLFLILSLAAISLPLSAQVRPLKMEFYKKFAAPNQQVKVMSDKFVVHEVAANQVMAPANSVITLTYANKLSRPEEATRKVLKSKLSPGADLSRFKEIPELHVETAANGDQKAYSIMFTSRQHLQYDFDSASFSSTVSFLLIEEPPSDADDGIRKPIPLEVTSDAHHRITPSSFQINHLSIPSSDIRIVCHNVDDSVNVRVITKSNPTGYVTYLKVDPALEITASESWFQGYGVQDVPITVRFVGTTSRDSVTVSIGTNKGTISPNLLRMKYNQPATAMLRSEGVGHATISAKSALASSNTIKLRYSFPWIFIVASIVGGLVGGSIKFYFFSNRKKILKPLVGSIFIGIVGAVAYFVLGVNLLHVESSHNFNEFAVFGFSGLCALFGIRLKDN